LAHPDNPSKGAVLQYGGENQRPEGASSDVIRDAACRHSVRGAHNDGAIRYNGSEDVGLGDDVDCKGFDAGRDDSAFDQVPHRVDLETSQVAFCEPMPRQVSLLKSIMVDYCDFAYTSDSERFSHDAADAPDTDDGHSTLSKQANRPLR
jgi:hypothetical protein